MFIIFEDRPSDSPYIERVWRSHSERADAFHSIAACHWEMVVTRLRGKVYVTMRGPETKFTMADCPAEGEWFGIRFKLGTCLPLLRPALLRDRNDVTLPNATNRSFWLNGSAFEYPNFQNAESFVQRLVRDGLLYADPSIQAFARGENERLTSRTAERRLLQVTGLTRGAVRQIERARCATNLLRQGVSILDVTYRTGYYDQAHLTRSLKRFIGQTPAQIIGAQKQLSFLYNTDQVSAVMM